MGIEDHYRRSERMTVTVVTVNPGTNRIEAVGKDAAVIQISVNGRPNAFRWPNQGEQWTVERVGVEWVLGSKLETQNVVPRLSEGQPGELMGPDGFIPQHKTRATNGQGLVWVTGQGWVAQNVATQAELDAQIVRLNTIEALRGHRILLAGRTLHAVSAGANGRGTHTGSLAFTLPFDASITHPVLIEETLLVAENGASGATTFQSTLQVEFDTSGTWVSQGEGISAVLTASAALDYFALSGSWEITAGLPAGAHTIRFGHLTSNSPVTVVTLGHGQIRLVQGI